MNKIFSPIGRWQFIFAFFLFIIFVSHYTQFGMFLSTTDNLCVHVVLTYIILPLIYTIILFKRFFDISNEIKKAAIYTLIAITPLIIYAFLSPVFSTFDANNSSNINNNVKFLLIFPLYSVFLLLYLGVKRGANFIANYDLSNIIARLMVIVALFLASSAISATYDAILVAPHFRMFPTLNPADNLLVSRVLKIKDIKREDIVCIKDVSNMAFPYRVIGLPKEKIELKEKEIFINDIQYDDKYAFYSDKLEPINFQKQIVLDENSFLLMGDNRYYDYTGKMLVKNKNGKEQWRKIDKSAQKIFVVVSKNKIYGKVIAVNYSKSKDNPDKKAGIIFASKNHKFGSNPDAYMSRIF